MLLSPEPPAVNPLLASPTRLLFFTGKGGVGKTSAACATAISLADQGRRVLLVSTDPASNLDEVLGADLSSAPRAVPGVAGLSALNIDPEQAAKDYRERVVGPYRGVLPTAALTGIEEQLSGACTVEIAAFDEFSKLLGDPHLTESFDHVIFDTAPTGHTLRLLALPAAWSGFIEGKAGGTSCLGPLAGLAAQKALYAAAQKALRSRALTTLVLVARPEKSSIREAERTRLELAQLGMNKLVLVLNGEFKAGDHQDALAVALEARGRDALEGLPEGLAALERVQLPLLPFGLVGIEKLRRFFAADGPLAGATLPSVAAEASIRTESLDQLIQEIGRSGRGVVMTMGKGGVGKTSVARRVAIGLAGLGGKVLLTTTDPAGQVEDGVALGLKNLSVTRIDPVVETRRYTSEVVAAAGQGLDPQALAVLEEDLRSPCTEEIAVFRAFAEEVAKGEGGFVVIDTAPTGHTLLLLDAAEAYHREVLKRPSGSPEAVQKLLMRLKDPAFTRILLVTLPEATPIHEAMQLETDLARAQIKPFAWIVNQCLAPLLVTDPLLKARQAQEAPFLIELQKLGERTALEAWREENYVR